MDLIAVHLGAGSHTESNKETYFKLCSAACDAGLCAFEKSNGDPVKACAEAIRFLENDEITNAGIGSNLCNDGTIECDASIMSSEDMSWAGVGAISGIQNPILVAQELLNYQKEEQLCGLVPPMLLVGDSARRWAKNRGFETDFDLSTTRSQAKYSKYKRKLSDAQDKESIKHPRLDTIGAVAISRTGKTASGVSSGGIALKIPGRVGQAATFGAGCWAQDNSASTTSGVGEYLIRTNLARTVIEDIASNQDLDTPSLVSQIFETKFINSSLLKHIDNSNKLGGIFIVTRDADYDKRSEIICAHSTQTMIYGFKSSNMKHSECRFSKNTSMGVKVEAHCIT